MRAVRFSLRHRLLPYILRSRAHESTFDSDPFDIANLAENLEFHKGECLGVGTAQVRRLANGLPLSRERRGNSFAMSPKTIRAAGRSAAACYAVSSLKQRRYPSESST